MTNRLLWLPVLLGLSAILLYVFYPAHPAPETDAHSTTIALLLPDDASGEDPLVSIWLDAAREEGIPLKKLNVSTFLRPTLAGNARDYAGIIMPDTVHQMANAPLLHGLGEYVRAGGQLMLVYDAGTRTRDNVFYPRQSPLSELVGVAYAQYDTLRDDTTELGQVWSERAVLRELGFPPGKTLPFAEAPAGEHPKQPEAIAGYQYGLLNYPSFVTTGLYQGKRLLSTASGSLAAGYRQEGKGGVLFVNLPLGYLKGQTDGLPLHVFLRYFADTVVSLPTLSAAPGGVGGLVFNWHIDSNAAIPPLEKLDQSGLLAQGPFSMHFTAGPDARSFGDGLGMNLAHNPVMQKWLHRFQERGDALGNHGGWIHDYFGLNVSEDNRAEMERYLELNNQVMNTVSGEKIREYSAPVGTQPKWVTQWLEDNGFVAYYFTGNSGMAPTRSYREGKLFTPRIWSFPISTMGRAASFEEADEMDLSGAEVADWLKRISDYAADHATIRTVYSHPTGFKHYPGALEQWFARTRQLLDEKRFRWYTMSGLADFLNRREQTVWHVESKDGSLTLVASHHEDLDQLSWKFPKTRFAKPVIEAGNGKLVEHEKYWQVTAGPGKEMRISIRNQQP